jgi:guanylate kinase
LSASGRTVVLIGPGGVGKGTVARRLVEREPSLWLSRSWTTRPRRASERGDEYEFVTREEFERAIGQGRFLEWAEFHGNLYGTPIPAPDPGQSVLLEIEVQGAAQVVERDPGAVVVLLVPPSLAELEGRLVGRGDGTEHVTRRLGSTPAELAVGRSLAHHVVVNDDVERAVDEILSILGGPRRDR